MGGFGLGFFVWFFGGESFFWGESFFVYLYIGSLLFLFFLTSGIIKENNFLTYFDYTVFVVAIVFA